MSANSATFYLSGAITIVSNDTMRDAFQVLREVSAFVVSHYGLSRDFYARVATSKSTEGFPINKLSRPFALITAKVWRRLGGEYTSLADRLEELASETHTSYTDQLSTSDDITTETHALSTKQLHPAAQESVPVITTDEDTNILITPDNETGIYLPSKVMGLSQNLPLKKLEHLAISSSVRGNNPYNNTASIGKPNQFFNRTILIESLLDSLFSSSIPCLSIVGQRKSGKSSLVKHLARSVTIEQFGYDRSKHLFVYIDCARNSGALKSKEDFYRLLLRGLHSEMVKLLPDAAKVYVVNLVNPAFWQDEWDQLLQQLTDRQFFLIVILDEFDKVIMQENLLKDGLFGSLRAYGAEQNFAWITCTFRPLHTVFEETFDEFKISKASRQSESDFHNIFSTYTVGLFEAEDVAELISIPSVEHGVVFSEEEQKTIVKFGGRFPYFIQRACNHFFEAHLKGEIKTAEVLERCLKEAQPLWQNCWDKLTTRQQRLLLSIVRGHPVEPSSILESLKDMSLIYEEDRYWMPFSEEFGRFIRSREHSYVGLPVIQGDLLWKQYEVEEVIGRTLHSQVVKAQDIYLKRHWAIKLLSLNQEHDDEQVHKIYTTLQREARILISLEHKNIGKVHELRLDPMGVIMPWVEGKSLGTVINEQVPLAYVDVIKIGIQLTDALRYIHARSIIHRDIKPNNIILTPDNEPILIDFDIARTATDNTITRSENGSLIQVGTLNYSAFEQFEHPELVGPPADVFALGVVLYELITHERPYPYGNNPENYQGQLPTLEQRDIPDSLFHIFSAMLSQEPDQRPSADELYEQLQALLSPKGVNNRKRSRGKLEDHVTFCTGANSIMDRSVNAEQRTAGYLYENLSVRKVGNYRVLVNYNLPMRGTDVREIDLVVINKFGVFLLDVKGWLGTIDAYDDTWLIDKIIKRENPVVSINAKARILHTQLFGHQGRLSAFRDVSVIGLVVLVQGLHKFQNNSSSDPRALVGLDQRLLQAISSTDLLFRGKQSRVLNDEDIDNVYEAIYGRYEARKDELVENYRILEELSFGDLFDAYEAENINIVTQHVRLKRYQLQKLSQPDMEDDIRHFKRSMEAVFSLGFHSNILISLNFFPDPKRPDVFYEVTELVTGRGGRLDEIMTRTRRKLSLQEQLDYLEPLCAALNHAHNHREKGRKSPVYHRNICPETIFVTDNNVVKLGDFDFAKYGLSTINPMYSKNPKNRGRVLIDKPFTAPEVLDDASAASAASDIYALGVLWYFLACLPTQNPKYDSQYAEAQIDNLPLPEAACMLMKRMVAQTPFNRPKSVEEVLNELKQLRL